MDNRCLSCKPNEIDVGVGKLVLPEEWHIEIRRREGNKYRIIYTETFDETNKELDLDNTVRTAKVLADTCDMGGDYHIYRDGGKLIIEVDTTITTIADMMVSEFLTMSSLGGRTISDLFWHSDEAITYVREMKKGEQG